MSVIALPEEFDLSGRRALVTGASRGIGRACAVALARLGARIFCVARTEASLSDVLMNLPGTGHGQAALDLGADTSGAALREALANWGWPHVVVAALHVRQPYHRLARGRVGEIAQSHNENFAHLEAILPDCLEFQRGENFGRWIYISSTVAGTGGPGQALYSSVKAAGEALFRTLALEEGAHDITANTIRAGLIRTPGTERLPDATFARIAGANAKGRAGSAAEVAHAVAFLASPGASYITGTTLNVAGGHDLAWSFVERDA